MVPALGLPLPEDFASERFDGSRREEDSGEGSVRHSYDEGRNYAVQCENLLSRRDGKSRDSEVRALEEGRLAEMASDIIAGRSGVSRGSSLLLFQQPPSDFGTWIRYGL